MKCLLSGGLVVSGSCVTQNDVLFDTVSGKILDVSDNIVPSWDTEVIEVTGKYIFPGFIETHTHFDLEVAQTVTADDYLSGSESAVCGGTTAFLDFATQNKGESLKQGLENWREKAKKGVNCDYGFHMAISDWNESVETELQDMISEGITSFKLYMTYPAMVLDDKKIYRILKKLNEIGGITGVHCENMGLIDALVEEEKAKGNFSPQTHAITRPDVAESEAIHRLLCLAKVANAPIIIVHLSSARGYEEIQRGREDGQEIYVETCPQYLILDESVYKKDGFEGADFVCSPPLRKKSDQETLWNAIQRDCIETIGTDHCSFTREQKKFGLHDFTKIPNGMPGVETRPVLINTFGVKENRISMEQMCKLLAENPAKLYGLYPNKGVLAKGSDADIVVWDAKEKWTIGNCNQHSKAGYSPFEGTDVVGRAKQVFLRGTLIAEDGVLVKAGAGKFLKRNKYMK